MKRILPIVFAVIIPLTALAADVRYPDDSAVIRPAGDSDLSEFLWIFRPIVVFADTPADPRFNDQIAMLRAEIDRLKERDVVVLTDADPAANSPLRQKLRPRGFMLVLVGKDGTVRLRKPFPWSVREITASIDKTPMRQREVEERRAKANAVEDN